MHNLSWLNLFHSHEAFSGKDVLDGRETAFKLRNIFAIWQESYLSPPDYQIYWATLTRMVRGLKHELGSNYDA